MAGVYTISIPPNAESMDEFYIDISDFIIDDKVLESNETFDIVLLSVSPCGTVGSDMTTVVEIIDNDSKIYITPLFSVSYDLSAVYHLYLCIYRIASRIHQLRVFTERG